MVALEEGYTIVERSHEQTEMLIGQLSDTLDLARKLTIVMPEEGLMLRADVEELFRKAGPGFTDTMIVAKERNIPVLSDDIALRRIASIQDIGSTWTQVALQSARNSKRLGGGAYVNAILAMLEADYSYTSVDTAALIHEWHEAGHETSPRFEKLLDQVAAPCNDRPSVEALLGNLFVEAWADGNQRERLLTLVRLVREALCSMQDEAATQEILLNAVVASTRLNQRLGRVKVLPGRLLSTTNMSAPHILVTDVNEKGARMVKKTIGRCVDQVLAEGHA